MSRSYKKTPGYCDRNPWMKKYANRRFRRMSVYKDFADGCSYKKCTQSWDICDYKFLWYRERDLINWIEHWNSRYPDQTEAKKWVYYKK